MLTILSSIIRHDSYHIITCAVYFGRPIIKEWKLKLKSFKNFETDLRSGL